MRKIGELKGKPIIEGNPNEIKKNQIHYKESDGNITLSERKGDNTLSSVTSGSGVGENPNKIYYYKQDLGKLVDMDTNLLLLIYSLYYIKSSIGKLQIYDLANSLSENVKFSFSNASLGNHNAETIGIELEDATEGVWQYMEYYNCYSYSFAGKGNIIEKITNMYPDTTQEIIDMINSCFIPITKEEYEAMITYKPE